MALIIPKNNAEEKTLDATLKIYYDANDWVANEVLIDKLSTALDNLGIEEEKKEPQSYTKKTQVLAYYGFIIWEDVTNAQSRRKITDLGKRFYEAKLNKDSSGIIEILIESLNTCTFGRNVTGCNSDSDLEPPNIFLKSALLLDGLNLNEFAYILQKMEFENAELADAIFDVSLNRKMGQIVSPNAQAAKWKDPKPILALGNWGLFSVEKKDGLNRYYLNKYVIENYSRELMALRTKNTETLRFVMNNNDDNNDKNSENLYANSQFRPYITAIKSKPFLLLAGISGTGKSRIVRELARACWDKNSDEYKSQKPRNFEMVQVKPNWHDSSELIGYVSRVSGQPVFVAGDFLKFVARAWEDSNVPYFLCLDEMNLAPVEQYFAEYLSVVESRKADQDGNITTDPILKKSKEDWYRVLTSELTNNDDVRNRFLEDGICIPQNLIVIGTVNMDETTFSFSRKVLDRAMTIEMNKVDLNAGLTHKYEQIEKLGYEELIGKAVEGVDVYASYKNVCDTAITYLLKINEKLDGTPFKVAYRTRNEVLLYVINNLPYNKIKGDDESTYLESFVVARALDEITNMKILSRIEGDESKVSEEFLNVLSDTIKEGLEDVFEGLLDEDDDDVYKSVSLAKIEEMKGRLESGYTSFWS